MSEKETQSNRDPPGESTRPVNWTEITGPASRRQLLHLLGAGSIAGIAGCAGGPGQGTEPGEGTGAKNGQTLQKSATIATSSSNDYLQLHRNYWSLSIFTRSFEPLVTYDHDLKPIPWLAKSWERTGEDTWEFTLRDNVKYHNGDALNADRVISRTHQWLSDADWVTEPSGINTTAEGVKKVDEMTIEMTTIDPDAHQHENLVEVKTFGAHPDGPKRFPEKFENLIGTGPYEIVDIKEGQHTKVEAFDEYWGGNPSSSGPHLDELTVRTFKDRNTLALELESQNIDIAVDLPVDRVESLENAEDTKTASQALSIVASLHMNLQDGPTSDVTFRRALNYAVDQQKVVEGTQNGLAIPARGELPPMYYMSAHDSLPEYGPDKDKARNLVEKSDYDGETLVYVTQSDIPRGAKLIANLVQQSFKDIGVDIKVETVGSSDAGDRRRNGDGHFFAYVRRLNFLGEFVHALRQFGSAEGGLEEADNPNNQPRQEVRDRLDPLIETAKTASGAERKQAMKKLHQIIMDEALRIPLFHQEYLVGMRNGVEGVDWHPVMAANRTEDIKYFKNA